MTDMWKGHDSSLDDNYFHQTVNHTTEFAHEGIVDGLELSINTNHIEREWVVIREVMRHNRLDTYEDKLRREIFRQVFLAGYEPEKQQYVFMKIMAEVSN